MEYDTTDSMKQKSVEIKDKGMKNDEIRVHTGATVKPLCVAKVKSKIKMIRECTKGSEMNIT